MNKELWEERLYGLAKELFVKSHLSENEITFSSPGYGERAKSAIAEAKAFVNVYRSAVEANN